MSETPEPGPESDESPGKEFEEFIKYNCGESKELGKLFITVLSGILLFSINFSDKVGGIQNPPLLPLSPSWVMVVLVDLNYGLRSRISD